MQEPDALASEGWINNRWRPAIAWQYFLVCFCDFIFFPAFTTVWYSPTQYHEWHPLTLQGGGLYHLSMGAIIGVATWQRTQEKLAMVTASSAGSTTTEKTVERTSTTAAPVIDPQTSSRAD
jgi:hypothetical protein